jgi:hypothetical protein
MNIRIAIIAALSLGLAAPAIAQVPAPLFATNEPLQITISAPLSSLTRTRSDSGPISGTLTDSTGQALPISLRLRGITRRTSEICQFPPLRVDFTTPPPPTSPFAGQRRLKLVTHCNNSASFQQYVLLEYAAYRMLNVLGPRSFDVRLATIDYRDANGRPIITRVGYFIENFKDVARRNGLREAHAPKLIPASYLSPVDSARYALFQHMIANHDWSMRAGPEGSDCCHNAEMLGASAPGQAIPIPYDFDYSGLVGAPYAVPPEGLGISNVKQRLYRGYCAHNNQAIAEARRMRAAQPQILGVLAQTPGLDERTQRRASAFLQSFFADIATDADVSAKVLKRCVG